ncbi:hypothetical protein RJ639_026688 [Escallonia herrerae]|uniref:DUF3475 domain-containing protein n=1 Tax=Escallonia herrerae TaxID=1293975 RepID=A0AA88X654_9ASTE|nr:hypothetical protein RJ639_026688 [Escallonia herrerae]
MTNLNLSGGFVSGVSTKGNEISILSFEVANTIVKGANLMQSLSKESIRHLKETVLPSEGVQRLISKDMDELMRIAAADKRQVLQKHFKELNQTPAIHMHMDELKVFSGEVVRFGNRCKDPQWHNLDRYFSKLGSELIPEKQLKEEAEAVMQQLMTFVQFTAVPDGGHEDLEDPKGELTMKKGWFEEQINPSIAWIMNCLSTLDFKNSLRTLELNSGCIHLKFLSSIGKADACRGFS